jgi:hypothetical protein
MLFIFFKYFTKTSILPKPLSFLARRLYVRVAGVWSGGEHQLVFDSDRV